MLGPEAMVLVGYPLLAALLGFGAEAFTRQFWSGGIAGLVLGIISVPAWNGGELLVAIYALLGLAGGQLGVLLRQNRTRAAVLMGSWIIIGVGLLNLFALTTRVHDTEQFVFVMVFIATVMIFGTITAFLLPADPGAATAVRRPE